MSCPPPRIAISLRFMPMGGVAVFDKERLYYRVELVGNRREIVYKTLDIRRKDLY
jgi:hypothetical protein